MQTQKLSIVSLVAVAALLLTTCLNVIDPATSGNDGHAGKGQVRILIGDAPSLSKSAVPNNSGVSYTLIFTLIGGGGGVTPLKQTIFPAAIGALG
jgi:PBP1b-binding outer membrane lipoprotein LpoB